MAGQEHCLGFTPLLLGKLKTKLSAKEGVLRGKSEPVCGFGRSVSCGPRAKHKHGRLLYLN